MKSFVLIPFFVLGVLSTRCLSQAKTELPADKLATLDQGIYYADEAAGTATQLKAVVYTQTSHLKMGFGSFVGAANMRSKITFDNGHASFQTSNVTPVFYFIFPHDTNEGTSGGSTVIAKSPTELLLVRLKASKRSRELLTGTPATPQFAVGIDDESKVTFHFSKVSTGIYKVYFENPLTEGEYAFILDGSSSASGSNPMTMGVKSQQKGFDFSIAK